MKTKKKKQKNQSCFLGCILKQYKNNKEPHFHDKKRGHQL